MRLLAVGCRVGAAVQLFHVFIVGCGGRDVRGDCMWLILCDPKPRGQYP